MDELLFIDFENIRNIDLASVPDGVQVSFFLNTAQKSVPKGLLTGAARLGDRFKPIEVDGTGKNALDFFIAFYLAEHLSRQPRTRCVILTKDQGFGPLIKHLCRRGFSVRRASTLVEAFPARKANGSTIEHDSTSQSEIALRWLEKMPKANRPRKRKGLIAHLYTHFGKKVPEVDIVAIVDSLIANKKLAEAAGTITYHL